MKQLYRGSLLIRRLLLLLASYIFISSTALFLTLEAPPKKLNEPRKIPLPAIERRISRIDCSRVRHSCLIHNLYYLNNEFRIYLGRGYNLSVDYPDLEDLRVLTGLGWGSHLLRFEIERNKTVNNSAVIGQFLNETNATETRIYNTLQNNARTYVIRTHLTDPPENLPSDLNIVVEPTSFFSVLWPNLFRTMYAGKKSIFIQVLEHGILKCTTMFSIWSITASS